jgi:nitroreductase
MLDEIVKRRSQRAFANRPVKEEYIFEILRAGTLAPSGKNTQPWRFAVVQRDKDLLSRLAECSRYAAFMKQADCLVAVYTDKLCGYHPIKDALGLGACIQNMLLQATASGIGSCWAGEILAKEKEVNALLFPDNGSKLNSLELTAVIAFGYPADNTPRPKKRSVDDCLILWE